MAQELDAWDYVVFAFMLILSSGIGIYYGYIGRQTTTVEYLMAGQNMHWLPIAISLLASFVSAIALLGIPSEIYTYGIEYSLIMFAFAITVIISSHIYAPMICKLEVTSVNEV